MKCKNLTVICWDAYGERAIGNEIKFGCRQVAVVKPGYTPTYLEMADNINVVELKADNIARDIQQLNTAQRICVCIMGTSMLIKKEDFKKLISEIAVTLRQGSCIIFDYMHDYYAYREIEKMMSNNNLLIYEHLDSKQFTQEFFTIHNAIYPDDKYQLPEDMCCVLAVRNWR